MFFESVKSWVNDRKGINKNEVYQLLLCDAVYKYAVMTI